VPLDCQAAASVCEMPPNRTEGEGEQNVEPCGFGPGMLASRPKPPGIPKKPTVSLERLLWRVTCKSAVFQAQEHTTENRGVPGSSPGLAIITLAASAPAQGGATAGR
jgi:hypothetical protein